MKNMMHHHEKVSKDKFTNITSVYSMLIILTGNYQTMAYIAWRQRKKKGIHNFKVRHKVKENKIQSLITRENGKTVFWLIWNMREKLEVSTVASSRD